jgi:large subunit ribosomal protein L33
LTSFASSGNFSNLKPFENQANRYTVMRDQVILECTEAKAEGKPVSRYITTRNKKLKTERMQVKKYNPNLRRHTLHKEIK